jgi:hypothetical protein
MNKLSRITILAAGLGGLLWTVKALVITANDGSFDPLESVFFIGGLLSLVAAAVLIGLDVTRRLAGIRRAGAVIGAAVAVVAASLVLEGLGKNAVAALASGSNLGLEQEGGILVCGLAWLALAAWAASHHRSAEVAPAASVDRQRRLDSARPVL